METSKSNRKITNVPEFIHRLEDFSSGDCYDDPSGLYGVLISRFFGGAVLWLTCEQARRMARAEIDTIRLVTGIKASIVVSLFLFRPFLIRALCMAYAIFTAGSGAINVYLGYSQDGAGWFAIIPALVLAVSVFGVGLSVGRFGGLLVGGTAAYLIGIVVLNVDHVARSVMMVGVLATLIAIHQFEREPNHEEDQEELERSNESDQGRSIAVHDGAQY